MAEKAMIATMYALDFENDEWHIVGTAAVTNGAAGHVNIIWEATAAALDPTAPDWRTRIRDAVIAEALEEHSIEVDQVLFPDFVVLAA